MKLGYQISSYDVPLEKNITSYRGSFSECFAKVREFGYDGVEIMVSNPDQIDSAELKKLSERYRIEIPMICTGEIGGAGFTFTALDDCIRNEAIRRAKCCVEIASDLGAQVNIGRLRGNLDYFKPELSRMRGVTALRELTEYALTLGVRVALEPINSIVTNFINTTEEGLALRSEIGLPNLDVMLDVQHMYLDDPSISESIRTAKNSFRYVHVMGSGRLLPGTGNQLLDLREVISVLREIDYRGYLTVEIFQRPDQNTALKQSIQYLKALLEEQT